MRREIADIPKNGTFFMQNFVPGYERGKPIEGLRCLKALCICQMEELRYDGKVEPELSITELRASSTKTKVRLANVNADGDALWFNGSTVPLSGLDVNGSDVQPLNFSASDPAKGVCFELSELAALVQQHAPGDTGTRRFSSPS